MSAELCEVIITAPDAAWLAGFTRRLVERHLAACGHAIAPIRSIYWWDNEMQDDAEARVALHTRLELVPEIVERVNAEHSYDVPCVIALPIGTGNPAYLKWVEDETRGAGQLR
ncbi:MAG: divalent-cation tolerance protein CutA [Actinomycetota bacterium]|nr:divalent-cation tolerance protein CutA [Actinomycetota bacterium]